MRPLQLQLAGAGGDLTRLAFADLMLEGGAPISLITYDPLVYSDDARAETMTTC